MNEKIKIRVEEQEDYEIVENLTRDSFWNVYRPGCTEHFVLNRFRDNPDFIPELSLVLEINGEILGHIMFSWSKIQCDDGNVIRTLTFGPVSIHPNYQRQGLGKKLVDFSTEKAKSFCNTCILICGNPEFYGKCGFSDALNFGLKLAGVANGYDSTTESALAKLFHLMGRYDDNEVVRNGLEINLRGEISK